MQLTIRDEQNRDGGNPCRQLGQADRVSPANLPRTKYINFSQLVQLILFEKCN